MVAGNRLSAVAIWLLLEVPLSEIRVGAPDRTGGEWRPVLAFGSFGAVADIAIDSQHEVYVLDAANGRIHVFTLTGDSLRVKNGFTHPVGIAIDENDVIYVLEVCRLYRYNRALQPLGSWDTCIGQGDLQHARSLDVRKGVVYIGTINTLLAFSTEGALLREFPHYAGWWGVSITSTDGTIWAVSDYGWMRHYSIGGGVLAEWPTILPDEESSHPRGLAIDSSARLFTCDQSGRIKVFMPDGALNDLIEMQAGYVSALELMDDNTLYVGTSYPNHVTQLRYTPLPVEATTWGRLKARFR